MSYKKLQMNVDAEEFSNYLSLMDYWISAEDEIPEL
jgi:nitrate reductase assembly molybdenum cofactor insertion protein NarJ